MKISARTLCIFLLGGALVGAPVLDEAWARAGGGRSFGGRGSRSFSVPSRPGAPAYRPSSPQAGSAAQPGVSPFSQLFPQGGLGGGGFLRSMAGGVVGGMVGSMLFRSLGFAGGMGGMGGGFGGGIGLFDILLLAGGGYLLFRFVGRNRIQGDRPEARQPAWTPADSQAYPGVQAPPEGPQELGEGLSRIRQADPRFDEAAFREWCTDTFFRIQAAWMHRDTEKLRPFLTEEMGSVFRKDIEDLRTKGQINKLENISVRSVEPVEAWQEAGLDYITVRYLANLLDYSVEETSGRILSGSDSEPVKFEEFWTWCRPAGSSPWKLSSIQQAE